MHTTDSYRFAEVLLSGELKPTPCAVFGENLLYLFLGRPAYKTRKQSNDNLTFDLPVAIILNSNTDIGTPARVYPFDSGAFERGLYKTYFHDETILEDFELFSEQISSDKYISHFYSTKREYFGGTSRKNVELPFDGFEARGLHEMARAIADPGVDRDLPADERSSSVELQTRNAVSLSGNTLAVILPQQYLDTKGIAEAIASMGAKYIKTYDVMRNMGSREISAVVYHIARDIYLSEGVFDED
ncbi:hypothetical protein [Devosia sp. Root685]|uniref:hypothetical protein n=1 Tax=Devosia sp. Root685 TaxID=1736587 RepID=UPI0012E35124|nr:hypothetical protein [Devosia sp. Root685]